MGDGSEPPQGGDVRCIEAGDPITAADVGGSDAFEELAAGEWVVLEGSGDARILKRIAQARREKEKAHG